MKFEDLLAFRSDLYFEGAVQADWFYTPERSQKVAGSFVFHGPSNHAVTAEQVGHSNLMDTASFAEMLSEKMSDGEEHNPLTLAIAGYGTGKSHLTVALSELLSGPNVHPATYQSVVSNIRRADSSIAETVSHALCHKNLVLTINGMNDFDLHYELLRTAQKALKLYGESDEIVRMLDRAHEIATLFLTKNFEMLQSAFEKAAHNHGLSWTSDQLQQYLLESVSTDEGFSIVNDVYHEINGHPIRWDEGVSAKQILQTLLRECCGDFGSFDRIVILFDEFGRFLEYASANPGKAGDSALQQIFEAAQNAEGHIQFVGFIQADIKAYLQRVDKASNISRYIDRFDASDKVYLSSNLETIFANLIEPRDRNAYTQLVEASLLQQRQKIQKLHEDLSRWLPLQGVWRDEQNFGEKIVKGLYPLHPVSTYLLTSLTDWLQNRSSLTLLNEKFKEMTGLEIRSDQPLPLLFPTDLLRGNFFIELLNAEEQGRQRSQICILFNSIYTKYNGKFTVEELAVLLANVILRICRFRTESRADTLSALQTCTHLTYEQVERAVETLENEYAVLEYDIHANCFDFIADAVGANEFRRYLRQKSREIEFTPALLERNEMIRSFAKLDDPFVTNFGELHGIQTCEWAFSQTLASVDELTESFFELQVVRWRKAITTEEPKGILVWAYFNRNTHKLHLDNAISYVRKYCQDRPILVYALNDADQKLAECVVNYLVLARMEDSAKQRYERFYEDGLKKAASALESQFELLKKERLLFTTEGIVPCEVRLGRYLSNVFEKIYPKVVPFDFENFSKKSIAKGRKLFCNIAKILAMGDAEQVIKVQGGELKSRFDSLLRLGEYAWKAVGQDYSIVPPRNEAVRTVYDELVQKLQVQNSLDFETVLEQLNRPPYGLNQYSAVLLLLILAINEGYRTKLFIDGQKYNCVAWSEKIFLETKVDMKAVASTRLLVVDIAAAAQQYMRLFTQINENTDIDYAIELTKRLEKLQMEEELPAELSAQYKLASLKNSAAVLAYNIFDKNLDDLQTSYYTAVERNNLQGCFVVYQKAIATALIINANGFAFQLNEAEKNSINEITTKSKTYIDQHLDEWLPSQRCQSVSEIDSYERRMKKLIHSLDKMGYTAQAKTARDILDREIMNTAHIQKRAKLVEDLLDYVKKTQVITEKNSLSTLDEYQTKGKQLLEEYGAYKLDEFSVSQQKTVAMVKSERARIADILNKRQSEMNEIWDKMYDLQNLNDLRILNTRITSLLNAGVPARDREDFENLQILINQFCEDMEEVERLPDDRQILQKAQQRLYNTYAQNSQDIDLQRLIDKSFDKRMCRLDDYDHEWTEKNLKLNFDAMSADQLSHWKQSASKLPAYLRRETVDMVFAQMSWVDTKLSEKRVAYIIALFNDLSEEEKSKVRRSISEKEGDVLEWRDVDLH